MSSPVIAVRKAALARLQADGAFPDEEQVLDHMPSESHLVLPYLAFEEARVIAKRALNKGGGVIRYLELVELLFQAVTDPHMPTDQEAKSLNDFVDEVDTLMQTDLDLSTYGRTLREQNLANVQVFLKPGPMGAELKVARLAWEIQVL